jgi:hypothetical protein
MTNAATFPLQTTIADLIIMACLLVFLARLRHLIRGLRPDHEWGRVVLTR